MSFYRYPHDYGVSMHLDRIILHFVMHASPNPCKKRKTLEKNQYKKIIQNLCIRCHAFISIIKSKIKKIDFLVVINRKRKSFVHLKCSATIDVCVSKQFNCFFFLLHCDDDFWVLVSGILSVYINIIFITTRGKKTRKIVCNKIKVLCTQFIITNRSVRPLPLSQHAHIDI